MQRKTVRNIILVISALLVAACTPARLVQLERPNDNNKAGLHVYRTSAFNGGGAAAVLGANNQDYVKIYNGNQEHLTLLPGEYNFFVRSESADKPYELMVLLEKDQNTCLEITPNPKNFYKALLPFTYWLGHSFILTKIECPLKGAL